MAVIDADAHVIETDHTWDYLEGADRKLRPRTLADEGGGYWLIDGRVFARRRNVGADTSVATQELLDIPARLRHMDELEIDVQVLFPTLFLIPITKRPDVEAALCRSYNRWLADVWAEARGRLRWAAVLPLMAMDEALAELRWATAHGACAVFMRGNEGERALSDPYFFPLYEEASRLNVPLCVHAATASFTHLDLCGDDPWLKFKVPVVGAFHTLVFNEIPRRFPGLRFGFIETSAAWVPWLVIYLRRRFEQRGQALGDDVLRASRLWVACETRDDLPYVLRYTGEDHVVIGTDYGHADTSAEIEALRRLRAAGAVSPAVIDKILDANPRALYGL
ncbi:MAG TPA: amidohydrolase family protein [Chloroflexota bacterium]|jgi:predicted TIM-barrel fold metal-dependent hydrolase